MLECKKCEGCSQTRYDLKEDVICMEFNIKYDDCPCGECIVKTMCEGDGCNPWIEWFNLKYATEKEIKDDLS